MKSGICIAGGSGFIGQALIKALKADYEITVISRRKSTVRCIPHDVQLLTWDDEALPEAIANSSVVINLVGENIAARRWSEKQKKRIIDSRVNAQMRLVELCLEKNTRLISASGIGIYGTLKTLALQNEITFDEASPIPDKPQDFLQEVGMAWEAPLAQAKEKGLPVSICRFAVVIGRDGGMLKQLLLPFKLGLGGRVGSGKQPLSWIALADVVGFLAHLIGHPEINDTFNLVAPEIVSQQQFAKTLAEMLHRPCFLPLPSLMVRILFAEMGELLLLSGQQIKSQQINKTGYRLHFPNLGACLKASLSRS